MNSRDQSIVPCTATLRSSEPCHRRGALGTFLIVTKAFSFIVMPFQMKRSRLIEITNLIKQFKEIKNHPYRYRYKVVFH